MEGHDVGEPGRPSELQLAVPRSWRPGKGGGGLAPAGMPLHIPPEPSVGGRRRLRARLRGRSSSPAGESSGRFTLPEVLSVRWEAAFDGEATSLDELRTPAEATAPLQGPTRVSHWEPR